MIAINGVELDPAPTGYTPAIQDISKADRNTNGTMICERVATKRKISLVWDGVLSGDELSTILTAVSPVFFTVDYFDPQDNAIKSGTFYSGDRTVDSAAYKNGVMYWKNLKFDIIER